MELNNTLAQWEAWWKRENKDPVIYTIFPTGDIAALDPYKKEWMAPKIVAKWSSYAQEHLFGQALELHLESGEDRYMEEVIEYLYRYAGITGHTAGGYSFLHPSFGAACLAGFISGQAHFTENTVWFGPEKSIEWDELESLFDTKTAYAAAGERWLKRLVERCQESYVIAVPDFGNGLDVLSAIRHAQDLMYDTYDEPEKVEAALERVNAVAKQYDRFAREIIDPGNHGGHADVMRYLSAEPNILAYCDCAAMISADMFSQFVLPLLLEQCAAYPGRTVFHLDGPGMIQHVDLICSVPGLHAVQWVYGAGNPRGIDPTWDDLYRKILDAGKRICLCGAPCDANAMNEFFSRFPKQEFQFSLHAINQEQVDRFLQDLK